MPLRGVFKGWDITDEGLDVMIHRWSLNGLGGHWEVAGRQRRRWEVMGARAFELGICPVL